MTQNKITVDGQYRKYPPLWPRYVIEAIGCAVILYLTNDIVSFNGINERGAAMAKVVLLGLLKPSLAVILDTSSVGLAYMLMETLAIAFLGTIFGLILALPLAFLSSRNVAPRWVNYICLTIISIIRAFPSFMYAIMFVKVVGTGPFAGVLTMSIGSVGMLAKLMIESIEDMNPGIIEALDAAGCSPFEKIRYGIIPQLSSNIVSTVIYRLDINVKNATILGVVGAGGIGASLIHAIGQGNWPNTSAMLLGLIVMVLLLENFSTRIRKKLAMGE
ncbi:MAG: phosphonate ABC transporter, permease protein PhnE [Erysipelotrichaceae bacterium]|nr:phosphonate ABC transporter, permease protein PhnE [Erysipelotrichaceae bacterium]